MNTDENSGPKTFGERFRQEGLVGALKRKSNDKKSDPNAMHFLEHLEELRWVILKSVCAFIIGCLGVAVFMQDSIKILQVPLIKAVEDFGDIQIDMQSIGLEEYTPSLENQEVDLGMLRKAKLEDLETWGISDPHHQTRILSHFSNGENRNLLQVIRSYSPIFIAMKICFLGGLGVSLPVILYFVGGFVVPGLTPQEKRVFFPGCIAATLLFLAGACMTYLFILPVSLAFTIEFSFNVLGLDVYRPEAGNYYSTVIWMTFAVGVAFQFPLILVLLIRIGILSVEKLRKSRRLVLVILMVSAALITPGGDPVSLCILTIPLYFLYEMAIIVGSAVERKKSIKEWEDWDESIQGPRPPRPFVRKFPFWVLWLFVTLLAVIAFIFFKEKNFLEKGLRKLNFNLGSNTKVEEPKASKIRQAPNLSNKIKLPNESGNSFILRLTPLKKEGNESLQEINASKTVDFRAIIIEQNP